MKKFEFRLEKVLRLRKNKEEEVQVLLAQAMEKLDETAREMEQLHVHREKMARQLEHFKENCYGVEDLLIYQGYIETIDRQINRKQLVMIKLDQEVQRIRRMLLEATRDKKMLETVKTRHSDRYKEDQRRAENSFFDEVGSIRCARKLLKQ